MAAPIRLSQLSLLIQDTLQNRFAFQRFTVIAEVANHSYYGQKGFHYFDLVEKEAGTRRTLLARIPAVAWSTGAQAIRAFEQATGQRFGNDIRVLVEVTVDFHPVYGLKLTLTGIDASFTLGAIELARQATLDRLLTEGQSWVWKYDDQLHSFNKDRQLPAVITRIAVVSSANAAGYEDFVHSLENNAFGYKFSIIPYFTQVQGEANAGAFVQTLEQVRQATIAAGQGYDVVAVIRGGGAGTDLLLFDVFELALAVASFPIPVITGIGHQKNETITDMVAHTALKTPTKAAELMVQHIRNFEEKLVGLRQNLVVHAQQILSNANRRLQSLRSGVLQQSATLVFHHRQSLDYYKRFILAYPPVLLANRKVQAGHLQNRLILTTRNLVRHRNTELAGIERLVRLASPESALQRGFALVKYREKLISGPEQIDVGDEITVIMSRTYLSASVTEKKDYDGSPIDI